MCLSQGALFYDTVIYSIVDFYIIQLKMSQTYHLIYSESCIFTYSSFENLLLLKEPCRISIDSHSLAIKTKQRAYSNEWDRMALSWNLVIYNWVKYRYQPLWMLISVILNFVKCNQLNLKIYCTDHRCRISRYSHKHQQHINLQYC